MRPIFGALSITSPANIGWDRHSQAQRLITILFGIFSVMVKTRYWQIIWGMGICIFLNACGGGGGGSSPATPTSHTVGGSISGLSSAGLVLTIGNQTVSPSSGATSFKFVNAIAKGTTYSVQISASPDGLICNVVNGIGTIDTHDVSDVIVTCGTTLIETTLHSFTGGTSDGGSPEANLIQGSDGNFYGMTPRFGTYNKGTVFKITPDGVETILHSFADGPSDGAYPYGSLIQGSDGNFYGTTYNGGSGGTGTVFKITTDGTETVLYSFGGANDGLGPYGSLIQATDGNFYGVTAGGGNQGYNGTVFKITPSGTETVLYAFTGTPNDGVNPQSSLIQGSDGNLYGITCNGGSQNFGTVFKITMAGVETVLHSFGDAPNDGACPIGKLTQGSDGNFYGVTEGDGSQGFGTVFKITPSGMETVLYSFTGTPSDGAFPKSSLFQGSDGNLYGTTDSGGTYTVGTMFRVTKNGTETVLHFFNGTSTAYPRGLIQGRDGNFYGMTNSGGSQGDGTVFKLSPQ